MRRLPPLNALRIFETVALHQNFTHASDKLCLTQSAVSRQIITLEEYFGFSLFTRNYKGVSLTDEAQFLLPIVSECLSKIEDVSSRLSRRRPTPHRRTRIALKVPMCAIRWAVARIMQFHGEFPDIHVQITTTQQCDVNFRTEAFDAAIVRQPLAKREVFSTLLFDERLFPVCSPEFAQRNPIVTVADLANQTLLHATRDQSDWKGWFEYANASDMMHEIMHKFETSDSAITAAMQGLGVAIGDCTLVDEDITAQRLVAPLNIIWNSGMAYYFVYPKEIAEQENVRLFRDWLVSWKTC